LVPEARRSDGELARQIAELSDSPLTSRVIDLARLKNAIKNWPAGGWRTTEVFREYNLALTRGLAGGGFSAGLNRQTPSRTRCLFLPPSQSTGTAIKTRCEAQGAISSTKGAVGKLQHDLSRADCARWYQVKAQKCNV
jgi:hypothetical protein